MKFTGIVVRFFILFFCLSFSLSAQPSIEQVVTDITFEGDTVESLFRYVAEHISYDTEFSAPDYHSYDDVLEDVLIKKKGVCMHYAALFQALCEYYGYESYIISGYTKLYNQPAGKVPHAWNAVKNGGQWYMYDPTWASGYILGKKFYPYYEKAWYKRTPEEFIYSHVPFDPVWQLRQNAPSHDEVANNIYEGRALDQPFENLINEFNLSSEKEQFQVMRQRIVKAGITNQLIQNKVDFLSEQIQIHEHNEQLYSFHEGISNLTASQEELERYQLEKKKVMKVMSSQEASAYLQTLESKIIEASKILQSIRSNNRSVRLSVSRNLQLSSELIKEIKNEKELIQRYYKSWKPVRFFVLL